MAAPLVALTIVEGRIRLFAHVRGTLVAFAGPPANSRRERAHGRTAALGDGCHPDTDADGLPDFIEINWFGGSITDTDSDDDGLSDLEEADLGTFLYATDTDNDGLSDPHELSVTHTNPRRYDTDRDQYSDGFEISLGRDPLDILN